MKRGSFLTDFCCCKAKNAKKNTTVDCREYFMRFHSIQIHFARKHTKDAKSEVSWFLFVDWNFIRLKRSKELLTFVILSQKTVELGYNCSPQKKTNDLHRAKRLWLFSDSSFLLLLLLMPLYKCHISIVHADLRSCLRWQKKSKQASSSSFFLLKIKMIEVSNQNISIATT